jgi:ubiquinone/menaquinone biosynthesis C-methylase UbiE
MPVHEQAVERFYSYGAESRAFEADGFLSFGYWKDGTASYDEAAENLLHLVLAVGALREPEQMLNVACGNGSETTRIYRSLKPEKIYGIDITRLHIETCRRKAAELGLSDRLVFQHGDACKTDFPAEMFSHVVGIEGPAHFNTREAFFEESHRVLKPGGVLLLTDTVVNKPQSLAATAVEELCLGAWHVPRENWVDAAEYRKQLERHGFEVELVQLIGDRVFPGYASFNLQPDAILSTMKMRGLAVGLGHTFISWLLGYGYRLGLCDYLVVKAHKR